MYKLIFMPFLIVSAFASDSDLLDSQTLSNSLKNLKSKKEKTRVLKDIAEARRDFKHFKSEHSREEIKEIKRKIRDIRRGEIPSHLKLALKKMDVDCQGQSSTCSLAVKDASNELTDYLGVNLRDRRAYNVINGCQSDEYLIAVAGYGEAICTSIFGQEFGIEKLHVGAGFYWGSSYTAIICPFGLRRGKHIGITTSIAAKVGVSMSTIIGASGVCIELGISDLSVGGAFGVKASVDLLDIY